MSVYSIGELICYESSGVCRVADITTRVEPGGGQERSYYLLKPLYQECSVYIPTDSTKVRLRPVISRQEAERLICSIPNRRPKAYHSRVLGQLAEHYDEALRSYDCDRLIELVMSIHAKKREAAEQKRRIGTVDERFLKQAEELLHGELAVALEIPRERVPSYIAERVGKKRAEA